MEDENDFMNRTYECVLADVATSQNSILYLPMGAGRSYISILVIKRFSHDLECSLDEGGKIVVIVVDNVSLVEETAQVMARHLPVDDVGWYCEATDVDEKPAETWRTELNTYRVVVLTSEILLNLLRTNKLKVSEISVLVLHGCHLVLEDNSMSELMETVCQCPKESQPRILGMSATLLNDDVPLSEVDLNIRKLETNLNAKVITSYKGNEAKYLTVESLRFESYESSTSTDDVQYARNLLNDINFRGEHTVKKGTYLPTGDAFHSLVLVNELVSFPSLKSNIESIFEDMGVYAGHKAVLDCIAILERAAYLTEEEKTLFTVKRLICDLIALRHLLSEKIFERNENVVLSHLSTKFCTLVKILKECHDQQVKPCEGEKFRAIVFVNESLTARVMWSVLEDLSKEPEYKFLRPQCIEENPRRELRAALLSREWNSEVLQRFSDGGVNVLITTSVLGSETDIPACQVAICYDDIKDYRSFTQALSHVKSCKNTFVVMLPEEEERSSELKDKFKRWEAQRNLINEVVFRREDGLNSLVIADEDPVVSYKTPSGAELTVASAIPTLNRYCKSLTTRSYFTVSPYYREIREMDKHPNRIKFVVELTLPIPCPLRTPVKGKMTETLRGAKRLAAFELCKQLHQIDELCDSLLPKKDSNLLFLPSLFPLWNSKKAAIPTNTHSMHLERYPECLNGGIKEGDDVYLHVLKIVPTSARPQPGDNRKTVYYDTLASDFDYAIVSPKEMPEVCDFPLFAPGVDLKVQVIPSKEKIALSPAELQALFNFHSSLFLNPVPVVRQYMVFDPTCDRNSFIIAPIKSGGDKAEILWDVVNKCTSTLRVRPLDDDQRRQLKVDPKELELAIIKPWYRNLLPYEVYLVTEICWDMDADSAFPTNEYDTFMDYFALKYNLQLFHTTLPLLEVRLISTKVTALTPRVEMKKKRFDKDCDECREHMVPELCTRLKFPTYLWIKAIFLPSALHRLHRLLIAEELRQRIAQEAAVGSEKNGPILNELVVDPATLAVKDKKDFIFNTTKHGLGKGSIKLTECRQAVQSRKLWGTEQEPVDVSRAIDTLNIMGISFYEQFVSKEDNTDHIEKKKKRLKFKLPEVAPGEGKIQLLSNPSGNPGPQMNEVYQALTSRSSNEIQHQEKLTILGRAVTHLAATLYIYFSYANLPANKLQWVVSKLTSGHNLAFCGWEKEIQNMIKVQEFACNYWRPPMFQVPSILEKPIVASKVESSILNEVSFDPDEQRTGRIRPESRAYIMDLLQELKCENKPFGEYAPRILDHQALSVQDVAETVSALIGLYFKTNGLEGAVKVMAWFRLLPKDCVSLILNDIQMGDHKNYTNVGEHLKCARDLENRMQYTFRNRSYLLDALTHGSYIDADNEGQDRLSSVGYSILDFLVTLYVWEKFSQRSLEEREDINAALTNRVTFAGILVRHNLHKYLLLSSGKLINVIDVFVKYQDDREHVIDEETFVQLSDAEVNEDEKPDVPGVLADTLSALVGAVYLDTYCDLDKTWCFVYRMFKNEIDLFSENPPRQPKALLKDLTPTPSFSKFDTELDRETGRYKTVCQIHTNGMRKDVQASGATEAEAENTAAKKAIQSLLFASDQ